MTGFAAKTITITRDKDQKAHISIHLKALNSRYFEVNAKLPQPLSHLETDLIKLLKKALHRGYISFIVHLDNPAVFKGSIKPALSVVHDYKKAIMQMKKEEQLSGEISLDLIIRLANVFVVEEKGLDKQSAHAILAATDELICQVVKEREKEGKQLLKDLENRFSIMTKEIVLIEKRSQEHIAEQKERIASLLEELQSDTSEFAEARKNALYSFLDKIDIHEEIIRFQSHLKNAGSLIKNDDIEKGKRLDFILQELAREINTITAKCADSRISSLAINIKVEIEKAREQAQNIV